MGRLIVAVLGRAAYIGFGVMLGMWLMASFANAATFRGDPIICRSFAQTAATVATMRDNGVPWSVLEPRLQEMVNQALVDPDSYVKDADDAKFVMGWFKYIFDNPSLSAAEVAHSIEQDCLKKPVSTVPIRKGKMV